MKVASKELIKNLIERTHKYIDQITPFNSWDEDKLNWKQDPQSWSILECLEHLNLYGDFYLPEIEHRISASDSTPVTSFKSGILGNYFATSMLPKEKLNKMKTFKDKNPAGSNLDKQTITRFLDQQKITLELLDKSNSVNLNKTKTAISISKWIKLKLGDTLRVVVYHNERHMAQIEKIVDEMKA